MSLVFERQREYGKGASSHNNLILFWKSLGFAASNEDKKNGSRMSDVGQLRIGQLGRELADRMTGFQTRHCNTKSP
jgi:hypothetical protein